MGARARMGLGRGWGLGLGLGLRLGSSTSPTHPLTSHKSAISFTFIVSSAPWRQRQGGWAAGLGWLGKRALAAGWWVWLGMGTQVGSESNSVSGCSGWQRHAGVVTKVQVLQTLAHSCTPYTPATHRCVASRRSLIRRWKERSRAFPTPHQRASGTNAVANIYHLRVSLVSGK